MNLSITNERPVPEDLLNCMADLESRIRRTFLEDLTDADLLVPFDSARQHRNPEGHRG